MTLGFKFQLLATAGEGFKFVLPLNAFTIVPCTEAGTEGLK